MFTRLGSKSHKALFGLAITTLMAGLAFAQWGNGAITPNKAVAAENCQFFPETNFKACGRFLEYWHQNGGLSQQGFPISEPFEEQNAAPPSGDGKVHIVQYFQRARFELHPENPAPNDVLLGLLGTEQYRNKYFSKEFVVVRNKRTETKINNWVAKDGSHYLILDILITNTTPKKITISPASILVRTAQVYDYKVAEATYSLNRYLKLSDLAPGEQVGGELVYEVLNNENPATLTIDYFVNKAVINL